MNPKVSQIILSRPQIMISQHNHPIQSAFHPLLPCRRSALHAGAAKPTFQLQRHADCRKQNTNMWTKTLIPGIKTYFQTWCEVYLCYVYFVYLQWKYILIGSPPLWGTVAQIRLIHGWAVHGESVARWTSTQQPFFGCCGKGPLWPMLGEDANQ